MSNNTAENERRHFIDRIFSSVKHRVNSPDADCDRCFAQHQFTRLRGSSKKTCLPPVGSFQEGQALFVGTNPRCNLEKGDDAFYRYALSSADSFLRFSIDGKYVDSFGNTRFLFDDAHYDIHKECLARIDPTWELGDDSSVAELFMCGSEDANIFYRDKENNLYKKYDLAEYTCAEKFLLEYIDIVKPAVIVSFGWPLLQWFQTRFEDDLSKTTKSLRHGNEKAYEGYPTTDNLSNLHGCICEIQLKEHKSFLIFSMHPNARGFDAEKREGLLDAFDFAFEKVNTRCGHSSSNAESSS
jgi:hypothetical protein